MLSFIRNFGPMLIGALAMGLESLIWRALGVLGMGFTTYTGTTVLFDKVKALAISGLSGLPSDIAGLVGFLWIDRGISVIFSAYAMVLVMRSLDGAVRKFGSLPVASAVPK